MYVKYHWHSDPIQNENLKLVLEAFKTSPMESLYAKTQKASLQLRSEKLAQQ